MPGYTHLQRAQPVLSLIHIFHQLAFIGHPDRAHHRQVTAGQQGVDQCRGARLRQPDMVFPR